MSTAVRISGLSHSYPPPRGAVRRQTLDNIHLKIESGQVVGILGPNGGGKTTLFRILSTSLKPESGVVQILGLELREQPREIRRRIGVVFQHPSLDKKLTLRENLRHQGRLYGMLGTDLIQRIDDLLGRFSIADRADELVERLSGGLQRRGEIAKALLHRPSLLLLDEPSTGLDPRARRDMWDVLRDLRQKDGTTVLLTTHFMDEGDLCDRVAILDRGRVVAEGTPADLKKRIGGDVVTVHAADATALAEQIRAKFGTVPLAVNGSLRIELPDGHKFIPALVESFPGAVESVTMGKPTLEDVFVHETGHSFAEDAGSRP